MRDFIWEFLVEYNVSTNNISCGIARLYSVKARDFPEAFLKLCRVHPGKCIISAKRLDGEIVE